jgi:outer membrane protein insertion porin family
MGTSSRNGIWHPISRRVPDAISGWARDGLENVNDQKRIRALVKIRKWLPGLLFGLVVVCWTSAGHAGQWNGAPVTVDAVVVKVDDPYANGFDWQGLARVLIGLEHGDQLTAGRLDKAVKALDSLGRVRTDVALSPEGAVVRFALQPYKRIKSISVDGCYPLFESDVLKVMTLGKGDICHPRTLRKQANLIVRRYKTEGYIDPKVKISWKQDPSDGNYHIHVVIDKGPAYVLTKVKITGNHHVPDVLLMGMMRTWRRPAVWFGRGRFLEADLQKDVQKLTAYYRSQGYADVQIDHDVIYDPPRRQARVRIAIDEGAHYGIVFSSNRYFSDATLRKDLEIYKIGNRGNTGLRRSILNIRRRYLAAGFADVHVSWSEVAGGPGAPGSKAIYIEIKEGPRYIVQEIDVRGNRRIVTDAIRGQMLTRPPSLLGNGAYVASVLQEDLTAVRALYQTHGFIDVRVRDNVAKDARTGKVVVTLDITEGHQTLVGRVTVEGRCPVATGPLLEATRLKPGTPFKPNTVADDENEVAAKIAALGYPHVAVSSRVSMSKDRSRADIVWQIDPGPYVELGRVFWTGNFLTRISLLKRQLKLQEGAPFSLAAVLAAQRRLRDLDLFQSVQVRTIGLKEKAHKVHLLIAVVEKPAYSFELGGGYQTDKGFYGRTKVGDRNFLGTGTQLRLAGEQSQVGYRWETGITDPRLLGSNVNADLGLYIENQEAFNQDFGYDTQGGKLIFSRPWGSRVTTVLGLSCERRHQYLRERDATSVAVDPATLEPRSFLVTTPAIRWDSRDSFIQPHRGGLASLAVDISRGLENSLDNFVKYKFDLRGYHTPISRLTLAGRAFAGYIQPYGVDGQVPEDQLFFLGGTNSVRGFAENMLRFSTDLDPVGGRLALSGNAEARYEVTDGWELTIFVDTGSVQKATDAQGDDSWRWSTGLGVRYITPIGPIGLLYGIKLNPRQGESFGQLHISIGYTF